MSAVGLSLSYILDHKRSMALFAVCQSYRNTSRAKASCLFEHQLESNKSISQENLLIKFALYISGNTQLFDC